MRDSYPPSGYLRRERRGIKGANGNACPEVKSRVRPKAFTAEIDGRTSSKRSVARSMTLLPGRVEVKGRKKWLRANPVGRRLWVWEIGDWGLEVGGWRLEIGDWRLDLEISRSRDGRRSWCVWDSAIPPRPGGGHPLSTGTVVGEMTEAVGWPPNQ
jgi:hypothetical protein